MKLNIASRALVACTGLALVGCLVGGCTPSPPSSPSYEADVLPIFAAHCLGCHGNAVQPDGSIYDPPFTPPSSDDPKAALTSFHAYLGQFDSSPGCSADAGATAVCRYGAKYFAVTLVAGSAAPVSILSASIHNGGGVLNRMPPLPAPALDDWELKVVDAWIANPICSNSAKPDLTICPPGS